MLLFWTILYKKYTEWSGRCFFIVLHEIDYIDLKYNQHMWYNFFGMSFEVMFYTKLQIVSLIDAFIFWCFNDFWRGELLVWPFFENYDLSEDEDLFQHLFALNLLIDLNKVLICNLIVFVTYFINFFKKVIFCLILWLADMRKRFSLIDEIVVSKELG